MARSWTVVTLAGKSLLDRYAKETGIAPVGEGAAEGWRAKDQRDQWDQIAFDLATWLAGKPPSEVGSLSAELQTLARLDKTPQLKGDRFKLHLLATDTPQAYTAARALALWSGKNGWFEFDPCRDLIAGLQVGDYETFVHRGLPALVRRLAEIAAQVYDLMINSTAGFRAVTPYLYAFALIQQVPMVYQFEGAEQLLFIPRVPIELKWDVVEKFYVQMVSLQRGIGSSVEQLTGDPAFRDLDNIGLVEGDKDMAVLSAIGEILLGRYRQLYALVDVDQSAVPALKANPEMLRIVAEKFCDDHHRENRTERKNGHFVFDNGDNPYRIYFVQPRHGSPIIYKTFTDHDEHQWYYEHTAPPPPESLHPVRCRISKQDWRLEEA
ncbi:hypothetical protein [Kyrpidia spormannii]|uniref:CRISPR system ring nuclease SSO1393-like domain-containing protein n=1 Tax=Kyrpidia spormannii TaxID=2055160 RepID=A0A6F9EGG5_9BACL|nr:hypothetical protein [Kyrpidia spormannii]CAB3395503.1 conserved protein of unknown function [Kyrpidia spormannii]